MGGWVYPYSWTADCGKHGYASHQRTVPSVKPFCSPQNSSFDTETPGQVLQAPTPTLPLTFKMMALAIPVSSRHLNGDIYTQRAKASSPNARVVQFPSVGTETGMHSPAPRELCHLWTALPPDTSEKGNSISRERHSQLTSHRSLSCLQFRFFFFCQIWTIISEQEHKFHSLSWELLC